MRDTGDGVEDDDDNNEKADDRDDEDEDNDKSSFDFCCGDAADAVEASRAAAAKSFESKSRLILKPVVLLLSEQLESNEEFGEYLFLQSCSCCC